jgi:5-methyltetrahydropteroyltriglutamate--homocysteine methyltransferase
MGCCQFEDILESIAALDADVNSMETARSRMEMLQAFRRYGYPDEMVAGKVCIHSPRPGRDEEPAGVGARWKCCDRSR